MHDEVEPEAAQVADGLRAGLVSFLWPLLAPLDAQIDRRLVRTFARTVDAILCFRNRPHGLLLSELGAYLLDPEHAPAGTKRLSNLLRCSKWSSRLIEDFLWEQASTHLREREEQREEALVLWDESALEQPESLACPDLGLVRSSKAHRLSRIKPGFDRPPSRPIVVPGFQWIGLLLAGMSGTPTLAALHWWTNRGERKSDQRTEEAGLLRRCVQAWGERVCGRPLGSIFDQGFAGSPWLSLLFGQRVRFILRWPGRYKLADVAGNERTAWQLVRGKRAGDHRLLWDARRHCCCKTGVLAVPVLDGGHSLVLVVARASIPGICSPMSRWPALRSCGGWSWVMPADGNWRWSGAMARVSWLWRARASGPGSGARSSCCSLPWPMPSWSPCWLRRSRCCGPGCSRTGATE